MALISWAEPRLLPSLTMMTGVTVNYSLTTDLKQLTTALQLCVYTTQTRS